MKVIRGENDINISSLKILKDVIELLLLMYDYSELNSISLEVIIPKLRTLEESPNTLNLFNSYLKLPGHHLFKANNNSM